MTKRKAWLVTAATILALGASFLSSSAWAAADPHHPEGQTPAQAAPMPSPAAGGQGGGMMGCMNMMNMMQMMNMMPIMGGGSPGMGMIDRVEGRIAFLRAELKITDAQDRAWNIFAEALRANARTLGAARGAMMGRMGPGQTQTLTQLFDTQERWLTTRLEGTRTLKTAFSGLYASLSAEQKKTADEILAPHMGLMRMGQMGQMGQAGQAIPGPR